MMTTLTWLNPISSKNGFFMSNEKTIKDSNMLNLVNIKFFAPHISEEKSGSSNAICARFLKKLMNEFDTQQAIIFERNSTVFFSIEAYDLFEDDRPHLSENGRIIIEKLSKILSQYPSFQFKIVEESYAKDNHFNTLPRAKSLELSLRQIMQSLKCHLTIAPFIHKLS